MIIIWEHISVSQRMVIGIYKTEHERKSDISFSKGNNITWIQLLSATTEDD
jgi:hypothetical protein